MSPDRPPGAASVLDEARRWAAEVRTARDRLDPVSAAALVLIYEHEATPAQAAARLGLEVSQVYVAVADGMRRLAGLVCAPRP